MSYRLVIRADALADIEETVQWYDDQENGLGAEFARTVLEAIDSLLANPLIHRRRNRRRNVRWLLTHRFPYRVVYQMRNRLLPSLLSFTPRDTTVIGSNVYELAKAKAVILRNHLDAQSLGKITIRFGW